MSDLNVKKKNSLIELFRFLFAFNVLIGHGLFPLDIKYFGPARVSVEFFFILSGYLFFNTLNKIRDMKALTAVKTVLISRLKPIIIPMIIGMISNGILNYITDYKPIFEVFRYLWYIPAMLAILVLYAVLRVLIKNDKAFWGCVVVLCLFTTVLRYSGNEILFHFDYIRSTAAVSLGLLWANIPKLPLKSKLLKYIILTPIVLAVFIIIFLKLAEQSKGYEALLDLILYPLLIYITFNIDLKLPIFNYLGALSFGIYAYQCPARLVAQSGVASRWIPFGIIFLASLIEDLFKRLYKRRRTK